MRGSHLALLLLLITVFATTTHTKQNAIRNRRSIELSSAQKLITDNRLPNEIEPLSYILELHPDFASSTFIGKIKINLTWKAEAKVIELHSHYDLQIDENNVKVRLLDGSDSYVNVLSFASLSVLFNYLTVLFFFFKFSSLEEKILEIKRTDRLPKRPVFQVYLKEPLKNGSTCELELNFNGNIWEQAEGLFRSSYTNENGVKV